MGALLQLTLYVGLLDFGIQTAVARFVAHADERHNLGKGMVRSEVRPLHSSRLRQSWDCALLPSWRGNCQGFLPPCPRTCTRERESLCS